MSEEIGCNRMMNHIGVILRWPGVPFVLCLGGCLFQPLALRAEEGFGVFYSNYYQGKMTASGQVFDQNGMTAAHKTLPFGTKVKLTKADKSVVVTVNDRMPSWNKNMIDMTLRAARELGITKAGRTMIELEIVSETIEPRERSASIR